MTTNYKTNKSSKSPNDLRERKRGKFPGNYIATLIVLLMCFGSLRAQLPTGFVINQLTPNNINEAVAMAHAPDGRIFIAERRGNLKVYFQGTVTTIHTVSTITAGEQGLLGLALHTNFASNGRCYIYYTDVSNTFHRLDMLTISATNQVTSTNLMQFDPILSGFHNGGAMVFKDNYLYICIGESNQPAQSANLDTYRGKVLRLLDNGDPAPGNPYYSEAGANRQKRSIWAIGMRNPWYMSKDPITNRLYVIDVGGGFEEVNDVTAPEASRNYNYGWDQNWRSGADQANSTTTIPGIFYYGHNGWGCAITSGIAFNPAVSTAYPAQYRNRFYFTDWCSGWLRSFDLSNPGGGHQEFAATGFSSVLGLSLGIDGNIYFFRYNTNGSLCRLEYNLPTIPVVVNQPVSRTVTQNDPVSFSVTVSGASPMTYQWQKDNVAIPGATSSSYSIASAQLSDAGTYRCVVTNSFGTATSQGAVLQVQPFNARPVPRITLPLTTQTWSVNDVINYAGTATDLEDGTLPPSAYQWEVRLFHKDCPTCEHWHPGPDAADGVTSGSFIADNGGETSANIWVRLLLTVTDSQGRTGIDSVDVYPNKVNLTMVSNPAGLTLSAGQSNAAPFVKEAVVNALLTINAVSPQLSGDYSYAFSSWNIGGAASQLIRVPATNTTYTANFTGTFVGQTPFGGTPVSIPGTVLAQNYDLGGQGLAYNDLSTGNQGGQYRTTEAVDLEACSEGGFNIAYVATGEWTEYTMNVTQTGTYSIGLRVSTPNAGRTAHLEIDGVNVSGTLAIPQTGGWQSWQTVTIPNVSIAAGSRVLRLSLDSDNFNVSRMVFTLVGGNTAPTVSITAPAANASFTAPASVTITANAADADGTVSRVEFFQGATKIGEDLTAPYSFTWTNVVAGTYSLTARATDNSNAVTNSAAVAITVSAGSTQTPFNGTAAVIPGVVRVTEFDLGGQGIAYNDLSTGNAGGASRTTEDVDIEPCSEGGFNIGWVASGEWLEYTVNVAQTGTYSLTMRVATPNTGRTAQLELNGINLSGIINIPQTGGYQAWQSVVVPSISLSAGTQVLRLVLNGSDFNVSTMTFASVGGNSAPSVSITAPAANASFTAPASITITANASDADGSVSRVEFFQGTTKLGEDFTAPYSFTWTNAPAGTYSLTARATDNNNAVTNSAPVAISVTSNTQSPYGGVAKTIPGTIQAEEYDLGGAGIAFNDLSAGNSGGGFRTDDVDIEGCGDTGGGFNIGWVSAGEWLEYTVQAASAGVYQFNARVASINTGRRFTLLLNGTALASNVVVPNTGGWQAWQTVTVPGISIPAGTHVLRFTMVDAGFNLNHISFTLPAPIRTSLEGADAENSSFQIFPNPTSGNLFVNAYTGGQPVTLSLINGMGNVVLEKDFATSGERLETTLDCSALGSGIYYLKMIQGSDTKVQKVIIK
ncbi:MAG: carbohydrate-binding protein [Cytophagaceae bacterium]|jgi:glucose/arabinose dehydrogenase|nr:carbohydrate-binding protein [Cytophagaceae bacterium]